MSDKLNKVMRMKMFKKVVRWRVEQGMTLRVAFLKPDNICQRIEFYRRGWRKHQTLVGWCMMKRYGKVKIGEYGYSDEYYR